MKGNTYKQKQNNKIRKKNNFYTIDCKYVFVYMYVCCQCVVIFEQIVHSHAL